MVCNINECLLTTKNLKIPHRAQQELRLLFLGARKQSFLLSAPFFGVVEINSNPKFSSLSTSF